MYCWNCGERVDWEEIICSECGADCDESGENYDDDHDFYTDDEEHY